MNDPGLEEPIADAEKQSSSQNDIVKQEQEEEDLLLAPRSVTMFSKDLFDFANML